MAWNDAPPTAQELQAVTPTKADWTNAPPTAQELAATSQPSALEAGLRGAGEGLTLGTEPAIVGASGGLSDALKGGDWDSIVKAYKASRDSENAANKAAQSAHPIASLGGNLVGGLPLALLTGGLGEEATLANAVKSGAGIGAASTVGNDIGEGKDINLKDVAGGAGTGAIFGGALHGASSVFGKDAKTAFQKGLEGNNYLTTEGASAIAQKGQDAADSLANLAKNSNKSAGSAIGDIRSANASTLVDLTDVHQDLQDLIASGKSSLGPEGKADAGRLQQIQDALLNGVKDDNGATLAPGQPADATSLDSAKKLQNMLTQMADVSDEGSPLKSQDMRNQAGQLAAKIGQISNDAVPGLADANQKATLSYQALKDLGLPDNAFRTNPTTGEKELIPAMENRIGNLIRQSGRGYETNSGITASNRLNSTLDSLNQINPEEAQQVGSQVKDAAVNNDLLQKSQGFNAFNPTSYIKQGRIGAANFAGNVIGNAVKPIADSDLAQGARSLLQTQSPNAMKLAGELGNALKQTGTQRNAAIFSLMQQPGYRDLLKKSVPSLFDSDENQQQ